MGKAIEVKLIKFYSSSDLRITCHIDLTDSDIELAKLKIGYVLDELNEKYKSLLD